MSRRESTRGYAARTYWGGQSWDEMLAGFVDFAIPVNAEPRDLAVPKNDLRKEKEKDQKSGG